MTPERPLIRNAIRSTERPLDSRTFDVGQAATAMRMALREGGSCSVEANDRRLVLVHDPELDAPLRGWPWPFTLIAPHRVRLLIYEGAMRTSTMTYEKPRIEEAIRYFLAGLPPRAKVVVTRQRPSGGRA